MKADDQTLPRSAWLLLATLTAAWGFNWPMMKLALDEIPVLTFRTLCIAAGGIGLLALARLSGQPLLPPKNQWLRMAVTAALNVTAWNIFIAYGLKALPAGRAAILAYTMPLWVALLAVVLLKEPLTARRLLGVVLGMGGMALLLASEMTALAAAPLGALLVVGAAFSWGLGTVLIKRLPIDLPTTPFTAWQLILGGIPILVAAVVLDIDQIHAVSWPATAALIYNMLVAFILGHWLWFELVNRASAAVSSLSTLLIPVVGVFSSMLVLHERPDWTEYLALVLVLAAIATVLVPQEEGKPA
jgi:drug/metabolite transporter (DMT)-like permease